MGQRIGQIKTIYRAFFKKSEVEYEEYKRRLEICSKCEFNSANIEESNMSLFDKLRKKLIDPPFCTACGCQIKQKAGSITEACGLEVQDEYPKWNRIKIERTDKMKVNLINKTPELVNPNITPDGTIVLDLGDVKRSDLKDIEFDLEVPSTVNLNINRIQAGCPSCTKVKYHSVGRNKVQMTVWMKWSILRAKFSKDIIFSYTSNGEAHVQTVKIIGKIVEA